MPSELRVSRLVQFSETDAAGLVHFSNFFRYFEDAEHDRFMLILAEAEAASKELGRQQLEQSP